MANAGSVIQTNQPNRYGPLPLQLWKATVTIPAAATGVTVTSPNKLSGTVVAAWIDPATLTASATIKVYDSSNDTLTTHEYAVDYTVPNPAVETTAALSKRIRVNGQLSCVVATGTAADSFVLYVWVDPNADTAVTLGAGTAAIGKLTANSGVDIGDVDVTSLPTQAYGDTASITRPDDTTAYTAGDVIGAATDATAALTFTVGPTGGGEVMITSASIEVDASAVPSGMGNMRLHLYNVTPPSALADNAAWDLPAGDRASYLGYVDIGTPVDLGSTLYVQADGINKQITLASADVYGYLQTIGAFTPAAQAVKVVTLHTIRL